MNIKAYRIGLSIALILFVLIVCILLITLPSTAVEPQSTKQADTSVQTVYLLKEYNGQIGAFAPGETEPFYILETPFSILPAEDQSQLTAGIEAESKEELMRLIEDFEG